jgi:Prolyl oligopeptidase, N-terminal beta-propeller domain
VAASWIPHCYPPTRRSDHIDVYQSEAQGRVKVSDPYAWLEKDGEERERWLASQEALARNFLDSHPDRARLEEEIRASTDYEKVSLSTLTHREVVTVVYIGPCSSVHPHCETTVDGIGHITVACSHNLV